MQNRKLLPLFCLCTALLLVCAPVSTLAQADKPQVFHTFAEVPFDTVTPDAFAQALLEQTGAVFQPDKANLTGTAEGIQAFGATLHLYAEFNGRNPGLRRILLDRDGSGRATGDAYRTLVESDLALYVAMEQQVTAEYGEPDYRCFRTVGGNYGQKANTCFMFPTGVWAADALMEICEKDRFLNAWTVWGNVVLEVHVDWLKEAPAGYLSRVTLTYSDALLSAPKGGIGVFSPADNG
jgi:hypothetical protein